MNLIIDIGNTRSKLGLFKEDKLVEHQILDKLTVKDFRQFCQKNKVQHVALSSTAKVPEAVERYLEKEFYYLRLTHQTPLPIVNLYHTPETLGRDRIGPVSSLDPRPDGLVSCKDKCRRLG